MDSNKLVVNPQQAAEMLGLSRKKIYDLMADGSIANFHIGRSRRIKVSELQAFVDRIEQADE